MTQIFMIVAGILIILLVIIPTIKFFADALQNVLEKGLQIAILGILILGVIYAGLRYPLAFLILIPLLWLMFFSKSEDYDEHKVKNITDDKWLK